VGVNAEAYVRNNLGLEQIRALPAVLNRACPGTDVWLWDPDDSRKTDPWAWDGGPTDNDESIPVGRWSISGPGLSIHIAPEVVVVRSLARWGGFLADADLRGRVRTTTAKVVRALGGTDVIWLPDWFLNGSVPEGEALTIDRIRHYLVTSWGAAQPSLERIDDAVLLQAQHSSPKVWFEEKIV
jgi:hypothetical protein